MALKREYTLTVNKKSSVLNKNLTISTNDKGIDIIFRLIDCPYISLSLKKNLYARVILLDPLGKQIDSDVTSIVENRVIFRLTKNLMSNITQTGVYKLYIAIMDDKNNVNLLPPVKCTIEESEVEVRGLSVGLTNQSSIDNSLSTDYGSEISLFNADGSYNRTVWVSGDMITTARMNKLEDAVSNARDHILEIEEKLSLTSEIKDLVGTVISPIVIANLPKGFYRITGCIKDFTNQNVYELTGENYFVVTYSDDRYSKIERCLSTEKEFIRYKYEKILETIYRNEQELVVCEQAEGYVRLTLDEYQYIELVEDREVILPKPDGFTEIKVYIDSKQSKTLTFDGVTWLEQPDIILGTMTVIYLSYINNKWYGGTNAYKDTSDAIPGAGIPAIPGETPGGTITSPSIFRETLLVTANEIKLTSTPIQDVTLYSNCTIRIPSELDGKNITLNVLSMNGLTVRFLQGVESQEVQLEGDSLTIFNINIKSENSIISRINGGIGVAPEPDKVKYTIRNNLTNCSSSNTSSSLTEGESYKTNITANSGYILGRITVTMNGYDITSSAVNGNNINIPNVTGNLVITATAEPRIYLNKISDISVQKGQTFNILYSTNISAVKHEISWDRGNTFYDKTSEILIDHTVNYKYRHDADTEYDSFDMAIRVTDANGNTDVKYFTITFENNEPEVEEPTNYTITRNLSNCSSSNTSTSVRKGSPYITTIMANNDNAMKSISVLMNGANITSGHVTPIYDETTYTITKNLSNCSSSNTSNSVSKGSSYTTNIMANDNGTMDSISVLMNGVDIANGYVTPIYGKVIYTITKNLINCGCSNTSTSASEGSGYISKITANSGYTLSSIKVTMSGNDVTSSAVDGNIVNISNVTGNIVITAKAESSGFIFTRYKRLDDGVLVDYTDESEATYYATVGMNPVEPASNYAIEINSCNYICVCYYDKYKNYITYTEANTDDWSIKQLSTTIVTPSNAKYIRVCATNRGVQVTGTLTKTINSGFVFTKYKRLDNGVLIDYTDESEATYYATVNLNPVTPRSNYIISINLCNYICVCYYDENYNYLTYTEANTDNWSAKQFSTTITIPSNARYVRVCATNRGDQVVGTLIKTDEVGGFTFTKYKKLDDGVLVDYTDESEATYHATVNLNEVTPNANYIVKINSCSYMCVCYYDKDHNYISYTETHTDDWSVKQLLTSIRIPSNIKYIRVCATNSGSQVVGVLTEIIDGGGTAIEE